MRLAGFDIFPPNDATQRVRLRRFFVGSAAHVLNLAFVLLCWGMGYLSDDIVATYASVAIAFNLIVYTVIRSGLNRGFKDPSLTFFQISVPAMLGLYVMYFAGLARGAFLLIGLAMFSFGMFRFRTRGFMTLAALILAVYALLIGLLAHYQGGSINLKLELLLWVAFAMTLGQFSFLAGMVDALRRNVGDKNQQLAKQNAELQTALQRIHDMAIRDELTGVYNRRFLMERITEESTRCIRSGSVFCLCMLDIDYFKQVNDTYGHLGGDNVLRSVATTAAQALRQADLFGRYGGEEFVLLLNDTTLEGAMVTAERLRGQIENLRFDDIAPELRVTISLGVAEHVRKADAATTLQRADAALYRAKESGRNRSVGAPTLDAPTPSVTPPPWH